jgi:hypothetical protein
LASSRRSTSRLKQGLCAGHCSESQRARQTARFELQSPTSLKDAKRLEVDVRFYGLGVPGGLLVAVFSVMAGTGAGWTIFGIATALCSFGGVGARAVYGNLRFRSVAWFYGDLLRMR